MMQPMLMQHVGNSAIGFDVPRANLLINGGFEDWSNGPGPFDQADQPAANGWVVYPNANGETPIIEQVSSTAPAGSVSAVLVRGTSTQANIIAQSIDPAQIALNGMTLSLSFMAQGPVGAQVQAAFGIVGDVAYVTQPAIDTTGDWQTVRMTATIPSGAPTGVTVVLSGIGQYDFYFDNASLVVGDMPADYIPTLPATGVPGPQGIQGPPGAANAIYTASWIWSNNTSPPPTSGHIRANGATASAATVLYINKVTDGGTDVSPFLAALKVGTDIRIQEKADASNWGRYDMTAVPADNGTYFSFAVVFLEGGSTGNVTNNTDLDVSFLTEGATAAQWYTGTGAPAATLGKPGDMYLETDGEVWQSNATTGWTQTSTNLSGPPGPAAGIDSELRAYIQRIMAVLDPNGPPPPPP